MAKIIGVLNRPSIRRVRYLENRIRDRTKRSRFFVHEFTDVVVEFVDENSDDNAGQGNPKMNYLLSVVFAIVLVAPGQQQTASQTYSQGSVQPQTPGEQRLYEDYIQFLNGLDARRIADDYVAATRDIKSQEPKDQKRGLAVLGASGEIDAIAWIAPLLDSNESGVRIDAGLALEKIVSEYELRRRDMLYPEKIVILPRAASDIDLRPLAWLVLKMMRLPDDGNTAAYAATMAGYLGLSDLAGELKVLLKSRHPSVRNSAQHALKVLRGK